MSPSLSLPAASLLTITLSVATASSSAQEPPPGTAPPPADSAHQSWTRKEFASALASVSRPEATRRATERFLRALGFADEAFVGAANAFGSSARVVVGPVTASKQKTANLDSDKDKEIVLDIEVGGATMMAGGDPNDPSLKADGKMRFVAVLDVDGERLVAKGGYAVPPVATAIVTTVYAESAKFQDVFVVERYAQPTPDGDGPVTAHRQTRILSAARAGVEQLGEIEQTWTEGDKELKEVKLKGKAPKRAIVDGDRDYLFDADKRQYVIVPSP